MKIKKFNEGIFSDRYKDDDSSTRISLDRSDFKKLVTGGIVNKNGVQIALSDIGFEAMISEIRNAMK